MIKTSCEAAHYLLLVPRPQKKTFSFNHPIYPPFQTILLQEIFLYYFPTSRISSFSRTIIFSRSSMSRVYRRKGLRRRCGLRLNFLRSYEAFSTHPQEPQAKQDDDSDRDTAENHIDQKTVRPERTGEM